MNKAKEERWKERNKQRALQRQEERLPPSTLEDEDDWEINTYTKDYHIEIIFNAHLCTMMDEKVFDMRGIEACVDLEHQEAATFYWGSPTTMYVTYGSYIDGLNDLRKLRAYLLKEKVKVWVDDDTPVEAICDCFPLFFSGLEFYSLDE
jgi:hypothetical protein